MGVKKGSDLIFKLTQVVARELDLMVDLSISKHASDNTPPTTPPNKRVMDCDVSNIIHKEAYRRSGVYNSALVRDVAMFLKTLATDTGYVITAVLDGNIRPQTKRDAFKRRYESTMGKINAFYCRQSAMKIAAKPEEERSDEEKRKLNEFNREAKRLESTGRLHVPSTFKAELEEMLEHVGAYIPDRVSGGVVSREIIQAEFESDYMIAYRIRSHQSTLVYSSDADMNALCGPHCLCIRSFGEEKNGKRKRKNGDNETTVYEYEVTAGSNTFMKEIKECIEANSPESKIIYKDAKFPLLEGTVPPYLTALYLVGLGCDVLPGGISYITPLSITKELNKIKNEHGVSPHNHTEIFNRLIDFYIKKDITKAITKDDILTYCRAFLWQPAVEMRSKNDPVEWKYVFFRPTTLHPYLCTFAHPDSDIIVEDKNVSAPEMKQCKGIHSINLPHTFLASESSYTCTSCNKCFCMTCGYAPQKDRDGKKTKHSLIFYENMDEEICVDCYKQRVFLPHSCSLEDVLSIEEMKIYLREKNVMLGNEITPHEVQELYELTLVSQSRENNLSDVVPFPTYPTETLVLNNQKFGFGELVTSFEIRNGGTFINLPSLSDDLIPETINLMANIVRYDNPNNVKEIRKIDYKLPVLDVLPAMILNFAEMSRVGSGYRLLKRCLRHALDPKAFQLENTTAHLFKHEKDGQIGLVLSNRVSASMKETIYNTKIAFTSKEIVATQCDCRAGGCGKERVLCVHNLPVLYQFVMLMDDGLSEHLLVELCSRWHSGLEGMMCNSGNIEKMKNNINILMQCAGTKAGDIYNANHAELTIKEMLDICYATGTQRAKQIPQSPPVKQLRPIRDIKFCSVVKRAKERKLVRVASQAEQNNSINVSPDEQNDSIDVQPDYYEIFTSLKALGFDPEKSLFTGFRVLMMRTDISLQCKSKNVVSEYIEYKREKFTNVCIEHTYARKKPQRESQIRKKRDPPPPPPTSTAPSSPSTAVPIQHTICQPAAPVENDPPPPPPTSTAPSSPSTAVPIQHTICQPAAPVEKKVWRRGPRKKCCFPKCEHNERTDSGIKMIQTLPKNRPSFENGRMRDVRIYLKKEMERHFTLKACRQKDEGCRYYLCTNHEMRKEYKSTAITRVGKNNKNVKCTIKHSFQVPNATGTKATAPSARQTKGLGLDRVYNRLMNDMKADAAHLNQIKPNNRKYPVNVAEVALNIFALNESLEDECERLRKENEEFKKENEKLKSAEQNPTPKKEQNRTKKEWMRCSMYELPTISFDEMKDKKDEVKRRTGFLSLEHLLSYVLIICNGEMTTMMHTYSSLTWLEEWFFYFEYKWGRTLTRWIDAAAIYKISEKGVRTIFQKKLEDEKNIRKRWPLYVSYKEDHALTKEKWRTKFQGKRIIMWDDTNVNFTFQPSGADEQRLTYSLYYGSNCAKGGVFIQLCGWLGVESLWVGATSDSHYQEKTNIFKRQDSFAQSDKVNGDVIPFTNILDKGYRVHLPAWRAGRQEVIQPTFVMSDRKFSSRDTIHTADVAATRSANERGVNQSKRSGYIQRGIRQNASVALMDDVWLTWSFQTNFMYGSVL